MLLFKYPYMKRCLMTYKQDIIDQQEEAGEEEEGEEKQKLDDDEIEALAYNKLMEEGVGTDDVEQIICEDYTDEEIKTDHDAIDWETANEEVLRLEEEKKKAQMASIKEKERQRLEQEFLAK